VAIRSTITADTYFNTQVLVDSKLHAEFFKHLPGILTGIGIIGTFFGLIEGLKKFEVSDNAAVVRDGLTSLMDGVEAAFSISASAIVFAILVTLLEKWLLAALYKKTEDIALDIDARFESGAGEEYLARLVSSSEDSASQSKMLKDALVKELGDILRDISEAQIRNSLQGNVALGEAISTSIRESLREPLGDIANMVRTASSDQSATAVQMLNDVMVSFSQRLNDLFGGQINSINEMNKQSAQGMQEAVASLNSLIGKLEESGKQATSEMAEAMLASVTAMEERQAAINAQSQEFVNQIRSLVENSQAATQQKVQEALEAIAQQMATILGELGATQSKTLDENRDREKAMNERAAEMMAQMMERLDASLKAIEDRQKITQSEAQDAVDKMQKRAEAAQSQAEKNLSDSLGAVGQQMTTLIEQLAEAQTAALTKNREREQEMADRASSLVRQMSDSVSKAVAEMAEASRAMARSVATLSSTTASSVDKMNVGADKLGVAASNFAAAGDKVTGIVGQVGIVSGKLSELSGQLTSSAGSLQDVLRDYQAQRQAVVALLAEVRVTIEAARKDARITSDILSRIELSAAKLASAQQAAEEYLDGINEVLASSSDAFRDAVVSTLNSVNREFHTQLSTAVGLLGGAVQELEASLGSFAPQT